MKAIFRINLILALLLSTIVSTFAHTERNILSVYIDSYNRIFVERELIDIKDLKDIVKEFITNPTCNYENSEQREVEIEPFGKVMVSKGVVSIQCKRNTTYGFYIKVQNELEKAFNELRNEFAIAYFNNYYKKLNRFNQKAINKIYPKSISEAEPNLVRNEKGELVKNDSYWGYWY